MKLSKNCQACGIEKLNTSDNFYWRNDRSCFYSKCIECSKAHIKCNRALFTKSFLDITPEPMSNVLPFENRAYIKVAEHLQVKALAFDSDDSDSLTNRVMTSDLPVTLDFEGVESFSNRFLNEIIALKELFPEIKLENLVGLAKYKLEGSDYEKLFSNALPEETEEEIESELCVA